MREIRFRVWDKVDYMSSPFTLEDLQLRKIQFTSECSAMQFTGLYDKNNQPIYEGDIVIVENSDNGDNDVTTICKWDNGCFVLEDLAGGHWTRQLFHQSHRLSIVGNQYQNPELIHQP